MIVDGTLCWHLATLLSAPRIKPDDSSQIQLYYNSGAKIRNEPLVERLSAVFVRLLTHIFTYFCFHTIDGVFDNIRKLTGSGWQLVLNAGINFTLQTQCHFFCTLYIFSLSTFYQPFASW